MEKHFSMLITHTLFQWNVSATCFLILRKLFRNVFQKYFLKFNGNTAAPFLDDDRPLQRNTFLHCFLNLTQATLCRKKCFYIVLETSQQHHTKSKKKNIYAIPLQKLFFYILHGFRNLGAKLQNHFTEACLYVHCVRGNKRAPLQNKLFFQCQRDMFSPKTNK